MLIIGAKGFAIEVLEILHQLNIHEGVHFYDDINQDNPEYLFDKFKILTHFSEANEYFKTIDNKFILGIGNPVHRKNLAEKFTGIGGKLTSLISPFAHIGSYDNSIGEGVCIMTGAVITNSITIKKGCLINLNCTIGHNSFIGEYCELSPGVHISGFCRMGNNCKLGTGSVLLPGIELGDEVIIGAGAVVNKNIGKDSTAVGIPAKVIKIKNNL